MHRTLNYEPHHILHLYRYEEVLDGAHYVFKFGNGFGASVIKHRGTYGYQDDKWELAVIKFSSDGHSYDSVYYTDITDDVIGWLTDEDVNKLLERIQNLDENGKETNEDETEQD